MEEKDTGYESGYSFVMTLLAELRQQYARQVKIMYVMIFVITALLSYIFYDRWLDSQVESSIVADSYINQDNTSSMNDVTGTITNNIK